MKKKENIETIWKYRRNKNINETENEDIENTEDIKAQRCRATYRK